jgi:Holliday junction resolvasome RuvABC DNA-binding subunit
MSKRTQQDARPVYGYAKDRKAMFEQLAAIRGISCNQAELMYNSMTLAELGDALSTLRAQVPAQADASVMAVA